MTSKEALEELKIYLPAIYSEVAKCLNTIKQDLEAYEQLEKENQTLNEALDFAKVDYTTARINLDNASARIKELEKENQDLKDKLEQFRNTFKNHSNETEKFVDELWEENCKYINAIEILKNKNVDIFFLRNNCEFVLDNYNYEIEDNIMMYCYKDCSTLTQQECDLLKEVLEDE